MFVDTSLVIVRRGHFATFELLTRTFADDGRPDCLGPPGLVNVAAWRRLSRLALAGSGVCRIAAVNRQCSGGVNAHDRRERRCRRRVDIVSFQPQNGKPTAQLSANHGGHRAGWLSTKVYDARIHPVRFVATVQALGIQDGDSLIRVRFVKPTRHPHGRARLPVLRIRTIDPPC
jgi:hypothetical protein